MQERDEGLEHSVVHGSRCIVVEVEALLAKPSGRHLQTYYMQDMGEEDTRDPVAASHQHCATKLEPPHLWRVSLTGSAVSKYNNA